MFFFDSIDGQEKIIVIAEGKERRGMSSMAIKMEDYLEDRK